MTNKISGIRKKLLDYQVDLVASRGCCDPVDFQEELQFVLNKLELAENALQKVVDRDGYMFVYDTLSSIREE